MVWAESSGMIVFTPLNLTITSSSIRIAETGPKLMAPFTRTPGQRASQVPLQQRHVLCILSILSIDDFPCELSGLLPSTK